jgi:HK97 family phage portal protein
MTSDLVYSCIELRANSAGEPPLCVYRTGQDEKLDEHPALDLLNKPNPFIGRSAFWANLLMHMDIGGNAYIEKVRSGSGKLVELWLLRPDRMKVIPDRQTFIRGYAYQVGAETTFLPSENVIHFKYRHPLDDYYGLPPLAAAAGRVDVDTWSRQFTQAFFKNAGVPAGLLNVMRAMTSQDREYVRRSFRETHGGIDGWHSIMVLDGSQATYTPMGLPLGSSGTAMPELNTINETRILAAFGVPASLIPTMVGSQSNRGQTADESEREKFWELTMVPLFRDLDSQLTLGLVDDFPDIVRLEHDLGKVKALQEDQDKLAERYTKIWEKGGITWPEYRTKLGMPEEPDEAGIVLVPSTLVPTWSDEMLEEPPEPELEPMDGQPSAPAPRQPATNGRTNGTARY